MKYFKRLVVCFAGRRQSYNFTHINDNNNGLSSRVSMTVWTPEDQPDSHHVPEISFSTFNRNSPANGEPIVNGQAKANGQLVANGKSPTGEKLAIYGKPTINGEPQFSEENPFRRHAPHREGNSISSDNQYKYTPFQDSVKQSTPNLTYKGATDSISTSSTLLTDVAGDNFLSAETEAPRRKSSPSNPTTNISRLSSQNYVTRV